MFARCLFLFLLKTAVLSLFFLPLFSSLVYAEAFRILDHSPSATGQGTAFAAQADDPSAIYFNPAGITQLRGIQVSASVLLVSGSTSFTGLDGVEAEGDFDGGVADPPPASFFMTANLRDMGIDFLGDTTAGFGVNSPFGLHIRYPNDGPFNTVTTYTALTVVDFKPTIAHKVNDSLSLGAGADVYTIPSYLGEGQLEKQNNAGAGLAALGIPLGSPVELNGGDSAVGFNLSLLYTPKRNPEGKPLINFGFVYRSSVTLNLEGELLSDTLVTDARAELELPHVYGGALAYWPVRNSTREWKVEVDFEYADWSDFQNLDVTLSNGVVLSFPEAWGAAFVLMAGTEYKWLEVDGFPRWEMMLRGGYVRSQTPVPEQNFDPAVPDTNYNAFSMGLGFLCKEKGSFFGWFECGGQGKGLLDQKAIGLDVAYQANLYEPRTVSGNINPQVNGDWETIIHVGTIGIRMNF